MSDRRGKGQQSRPKPYSAPADKGKQRMHDERRPARRDALAEIVCYKFGVKGHKSNACNRDEKKCFRCGKKGHTVTECKRGDIFASIVMRKVTLVLSVCSLRRRRPVGGYLP